MFFWRHGDEKTGKDTALIKLTVQQKEPDTKQADELTK